MEFHENKKLLFNCLYCNLQFRGTISLNSHISKKHEKRKLSRYPANENRQVKCPFCDVYFHKSKTNLLLQKHLAIHHGSSIDGINLDTKPELDLKPEMDVKPEKDLKPKDDTKRINHELKIDYKSGKAPKPEVGCTPEISSCIKLSSTQEITYKQEKSFMT